MWCGRRPWCGGIVRASDGIGRPELGMVIEIPEVGGLHHRYVRQAA
jgi:hypothetical protein